MTLYTRFGLVLLAVFCGIAAAVVFSHREIRAKIETLAEDRTAERREYFLNGVDLLSSSIQSLASSYAWWDQMIDFIDEPDPEWATNNIDTLVGVPNGGDALWVFDEKFTLIHAIDAEFRAPRAPFDRVSDIQSLADENFEFRFYEIIDGELWQLFGAAVQDPTFWRNETPVRGYLLVGIKWNHTWLARLGSLSQAHLTRHIDSLASTGLEDLPPPSSSYEYQVPLPGLNGKTIATIRGTFEARIVEEVRHSLSEQALVFVLGLVSFLSLLGLFVGFTVLRPLGQIVRSLESRNPTHLSELLVAKSAFGEIARLLSSQFRQGRMLQEEIRRRISSHPTKDDAGLNESNEALRLRLASDLHDGPMQSIYAAGLKIGSMEASLTSGRNPDPAQLQSVRTILTECSNDLRSLLLDLEPAELRDQDLEGAMLRFERYLKSISQRSGEFFLEEGALDNISREAQLHLYYITRELISNAARHARPENTSLSYRRVSGFLNISWRNDGFTAQDAQPMGNGLRNIAQRVETMGGTWKQKTHRRKEWLVEIEIPLTNLQEFDRLSHPDPTDADL